MGRRDPREAIQQPRSVGRAVRGCLSTAPDAQKGAEMTMCVTKTRLSIIDNAG